MNAYLVLLMAALLCAPASALPTDSGPIEVTVKEKWTKVVSNGDSSTGRYLFSTTSGEVFSIQDTLWHGDFSSANRYARIEPGKTYRIWLFGIRFPFFSLYQNAYRIEGVV